MAYRIQRQETTGLWLVTFDGTPLGRGATPRIAITLAAERVAQINDPVTGQGAGTIPELTSAIRQQLLDQAIVIEQEEQQRSSLQSAAQTAKEDQTARAESSSVTNPPPGPLTADTSGQVQAAQTPVPSNAERTPTSNTVGSSAQDRGLDDPIKRQNQTQATPATLPDPGPPPPNRSAQTDPGEIPGVTVFPTQTAGVAAAGDDVRTSINVIFGGSQSDIVTQPNVLDRYASYTYSISIYLLSREDYARLIRTKQKNLAGYNLLIQSAGIPVSTGFGRQSGVNDVGEVPGVTTRSLDAGRNEFFQEDFYIDDLRIKTVISGKGTSGPHNVTTMEFRIIEPNGITLLPRLHKAVQQYVASRDGVGEQNYAAQTYLMVLRFYGYDQDGNQYVPVKGQIYQKDGAPDPASTPQAIEKFIPFTFSAIKFRVADRLTEYQCEAVCPQNLINSGPARGVIPYNVEITSKTLQELFNGPVAFSSPSRNSSIPDQTDAETQRLQRQADLANPTSGINDPGEIPGVTAFPTVSAANAAPPKASAISTPTITQGLAQALNQYQDDLVARGVYTIPDRYRIDILTPALQNSRVVPPGQTNQRAVPMGPGPKAPANQQKNPATQSQSKDARSTSALSGMSIIQFIDQYTRTSTYIYDQQIKDRDPKTQKSEPSTSTEFVAWYRVGLEAKPRGYDPKRNDYAYDITYQLSPYRVNDLQSDYFPRPRFQGTHKKYNYWFTGENTSILKFEQDFNYLYYLTINTDQVTRQLNTTSDYREYLKKSFSPNSAQSSQGQPGYVNEASANAADYLYSPADQGRVRLDIVGDPAWLQQGELWAGVAGTGQIYGPFLADGTINYEGQEVLFEIAFNQPVDYNLDTGVMDPTTNNYNKTATSAGSARQSYVYRATDVTNVFSQGRFTQELNGVLIQFDLAQQRQAQTESNRRDVAALPNQSDAETRRLLRQAGGTPISGGALVGDPGVSFEGQVGGEFGAYFGSGDTGGAVPFRTPSTPVTADSFGAEGFGDPTATLPAPTPTPPTSSGQPVGPASSPSQPTLDPGESPATAPDRLSGGFVNRRPPQVIAREP